MNDQSIFQLACQIYNESSDDSQVRNEILDALLEDDRLKMAALKYTAGELEKFARNRARQRAERPLRHTEIVRQSPAQVAENMRSVVSIINGVAELLDMPLVHTAIRLRDARYTDIEFAHDKSLKQISRGTQNAAFTAGLLAKMAPMQALGKTVGDVLNEDDIRELQSHAVQVGLRTLSVWQEDEAVTA